MFLTLLSQDKMLASGQAKFIPGEGLEKLWSSYTEGNDEKSFRQFVKGFIHAWHLQVLHCFTRFLLTSSSKYFIICK